LARPGAWGRRFVVLGPTGVRCAIQRLLENPLALQLLEGGLGEGDTIRVDARDGELAFEKAAAMTAAA
jgi:ATP-dependent Clp protease ATP-binding subunit ClpB